MTRWAAGGGVGRGVGRRVVVGRGAGLRVGAALCVVVRGEARWVGLVLWVMVAAGLAVVAVAAVDGLVVGPDAKGAAVDEVVLAVVTPVV